MKKFKKHLNQPVKIPPNLRQTSTQKYEKKFKKIYNKIIKTPSNPPVKIQPNLTKNSAKFKKNILSI
jgi:hypothetical protein